MSEEAGSAPVWISKREPLLAVWKELQTLRAGFEEPRELEYRHVVQAAVNESLAQLEARTGRRPGEATPPELLRLSALHRPILTLICDNGAAVQMLRTHSWVIYKSVLEATDAVLTAIERGRLILALSSIRAVIEQVALLASTNRSLAKIVLERTFEAANASLITAKTVLAKSLYGTRVDWGRVFVAKDLDALLSSGEVAYKHDPAKADVAAQSVLSAVDKLEKRLPGLRAVYELLCEVAHPNVGHLVFSTAGAALQVDRNGVPWVLKTLGVGAPEALLDQTPQIVARFLVQLRDLLVVFGEVRTELQEAESRLLKNTQTVVRSVIAGNRDLLVDLYVPCPCGSGSKLKFCCLSG